VYYLILRHGSLHGIAYGVYKILMVNKI